MAMRRNVSPAVQTGYVKGCYDTTPPGEELRELSSSLLKSAAAVGGAANNWDSPAYEVLCRAGLIHAQWRVSNAEQLVARPSNTTPGANFMRGLAACCCLPVGPCVKSAFCKMAEVPAGNVMLMEDGRGGFEFLAQGVHYYWDMFLRISPGVHAVSSRVASDGAGGVVIRNGDRTIVEVRQGFVGLAMDMGQPVLLPPGLHQWQSTTMVFHESIDLNQHVIPLGPYTLLTVDKGYDAVTQNNGRQEVLPGGAVHLLNHRNWKFEKFMTRKIQTDDLERIVAITGDNVLMHVDATVCWNISDAQRCAERAAETMRGDHGGEHCGNIEKLRNDVLKQAEASLSAFIGKVNFSDTFSAATAVATGVSADSAGVHGIPAREVYGAACDAAPAPGDSPSVLRRRAENAAPDMGVLFDLDKLRDAVTHSNDMTKRYGVEVLSINIISARPADAELMTALAKGAVAAAEAQQYETTARGRARAARIHAQGDADAEVTRADGSLQAAQRLKQEDVAVRLAMIGAQGEALRHAKSNLILGNGDVTQNLLLANASVVRREG